MEGENTQPKFELFFDGGKSSGKFTAHLHVDGKDELGPLKCSDDFQQ